MWGLGTPFSHVAVRVVDEFDEVLYYQASGLTVNCTAELQFLQTEDIVASFDFELAPHVYTAGMRFAKEQLGKPYSMLTILGFAYEIALSKIGINTNNPVQNTGNAYVCSQFAAAFIKAADNLEVGDISQDTPKALYERMPTLPKVWY